MFNGTTHDSYGHFNGYVEVPEGKEDGFIYQNFDQIPGYFICHHDATGLPSWLMTITGIIYVGSDNP